MLARTDERRRHALAGKNSTWRALRTTMAPASSVARRQWHRTARQVGRQPGSLRHSPAIDPDVVPHHNGDAGKRHAHRAVSDDLWRASESDRSASTVTTALRALAAAIRSSVARTISTAEARLLKLRRRFTNVHRAPLSGQAPLFHQRGRWRVGECAGEAREGRYGDKDRGRQQAAYDAVSTARSSPRSGLARQRYFREEYPVAATRCKAKDCSKPILC